jgi:hypothetical protein
MPFSYIPILPYGKKVTVYGSCNNCLQPGV